MIIRLLILFIYTITPAFAFTGICSWYGGKFNGRKTASGKIYNMYKMVCAHKSYKFGTKLKIKRGQKEVIVEVVDRGPYHGKRVLDLSYAAAKALGISGIGRVTYEIIQ